METIKIWKNGKPTKKISNLSGIFLMADGELNVVLKDGSTLIFPKEDYDCFYIV